MISGINNDLVAYLQKLLKALEKNDVVLIPKGKYQGISEFRGKEVHPKIKKKVQKKTRRESASSESHILFP